MRELPKETHVPLQDPMNALKGIGAVVAIFGGLMTREPMTAAFNSASSAMQAFHQHNIEAQKYYHNRFMDEMKRALDENQLELDKYRAALLKHKGNLDAATSEIQAAAAGVKNKAVEYAAKEKNVAFLGRTIGMLAQAHTRLAAVHADLKLKQQEEEDKIDYQKQMLELKRKELSGILGTSEGSPSGLQGDAYLKTLKPGDADLIRGVDEGRVKISSFAWLRPQGKQLFAQVAQYDPKFDMTTYEKRVRTQEDFSAGKSAQTVTALNMVMGHIATLKRAGEAMDNGDYPSANAAVNWLSNALGNPKVVNFNTAKQAVQDELERVFRGSAGSERDIEEWAKNLSPNASPEQMRGAWGTLVSLLDSRINSLGEQYSRGMGMNRSGLSLLGPHAQAAYRYVSGKRAPETSYGEMGNKMHPGSPPGGVYYDGYLFPSQEKLDEYKAAARAHSSP